MNSTNPALLTFQFNLDIAGTRFTCICAAQTEIELREKIRQAGKAAKVEVSVPDRFRTSADTVLPVSDAYQREALAAPGVVFKLVERTNDGFNYFAPITGNADPLQDVFAALTRASCIREGQWRFMALATTDGTPERDAALLSYAEALENEAKATRYGLRRMQEARQAAR